MKDELNNIIKMRIVDNEYVLKGDESTLPNLYKSYFVDPDGTEIMTLDTFIRTEMVRRDMTFVDFCKFVKISPPTLIRVKIEVPSEYVYTKLSSFLGFNQHYLESLPITQQELFDAYNHYYK